MLISFYLIYGSWGIARRSYNLLMDREMPEEMRRQLRDLGLL